jgi:rubrerythrin
MNSVDENSIISAMTKHELALAELYKAFGEQVVSMKDFWSRLAHEETQHAATLQRLAGNMVHKPLYLNERKFNTAAVRTSLRFLEGKTNEIRRDGTTALKALGLALDQEQSMLENRYFEVFETDSPEIGKVFSMLRRETTRHAEEIRATLQGIKQELAD